MRGVEHGRADLFDDVDEGVPVETFCGMKDAAWLWLMSCLDYERVGLEAWAWELCGRLDEDHALYGRAQQQFGRPSGLQMSRVSGGMYTAMICPCLFARSLGCARVMDRRDAARPAVSMQRRAMKAGGVRPVSNGGRRLLSDNRGAYLRDGS